MSRWFRFYAEALRNPKVLKLADKDFRLWVRLLAVASENEGAIPPADDLKHMLSMRLDHLLSGLDRLISGALIDALETGYEPHNWSKFQYKSDTSTDRVHKHREKRNVSETPPDTETDKEEESPPKPPRKRRGEGKHLLPQDWILPTVAELPEKARACAEQWTSDSYETHGEAFVSYWRGEGKMKTDWRGTWANRVIDLHSKVMRDQKFGNAPAAAPKTLTEDEQRARQLSTAETYERIGRTEEAAEIRRRWATGPPSPIGDLVKRMNIGG